MRTVKKMASAVTIAAFLLCCSFVSSKGSQDDCVYAATGSSYTVPLGHKLKESESLKWLKDASVVFHRRQKQVITGKNDDVDSTGSLKLTQLTKEKSGRYKPEVFNAEGKIVGGNLQSTHLCVIDSVKKPKVTMKCIGAQKNVSFSCNIGQNEKIKWLMNDKPLAEKGNTLTKVAKDVANAHFSCNISNTVSFEISLPVKQDCYKSVFPDTLFGISIWVFVGGGAGIVLVLILIVIICCIQTKRKRRLRLKDERELRLQWASQEQQHQHHRHHHQHQHPNQNNSDQHQHHHPHHHQQQPAGNTGPRQNRTKQPRTQQRPRAPEPANGQPQPSPRRATQASAPAGNGGEEQPPPLPQPRKKTPKAPKE
ncbi:T-cell surface antigen CD2 [Oreochromis niloticus]|uniref:CD2 n=2 Tax=Oreochromis TaxID=8139 RepID=A0A1B0SZV8_ORENI|nr:T-cell surface antigen CD2 [Oreochromis niloticus]XP_031586317.1 T-cell surface antigen CD2-like [Oreochromis aureus]ALD10371.1 CD2 [Oreochromis niloticus]